MYGASWPTRLVAPPRRPTERPVVLALCRQSYCGDGLTTTRRAEESVGHSDQFAAVPDERRGVLDDRRRDLVQPLLIARSGRIREPRELLGGP